MKKDTFDRARMEILNYIITFSTYKAYDGKVWPTGSDAYFVNSNYNPPIGSLCMLQAAPFSKWYLSWLIEKDGEKFLLQSIEDQSLCWWSNVGIFHYNPKVVDEQVSWRWSDRQFKFADQWKRACKKRDAYITLPRTPQFDGDSVTLSTRQRFNLSDYSPSKKFDNWRKVSFSDMLNFYDEAVRNEPVK